MSLFSWFQQFIKYIYPIKQINPINLNNRRILLQIRRDLSFIVKQATSSTSSLALTPDESARLLERFNVKNVHENENSNYSYTYDKTSIYLYLKNRNGDMKDYHDIMIEAVDSLAHIVNIYYTYDVVFWDIRKRLMKIINYNHVSI